MKASGSTHFVFCQQICSWCSLEQSEPRIDVFSPGHIFRHLAAIKSDDTSWSSSLRAEIWAWATQQIKVHSQQVWGARRRYHLDDLFHDILPVANLTPGITGTYPLQSRMNSYVINNLRMRGSHERLSDQLWVPRLIHRLPSIFWIHCNSKTILGQQSQVKVHAKFWTAIVKLLPVRLHAYSAMK